MEFDSKHIKFKHPANILISGPTGSGKTQLVRRILKNYKQSFHNLNKEKIKILWTYGQNQSFIGEKLHKNIEIQYKNGLPDDSDLNSQTLDIVVIDDLMDEITKDKSFENIFIKKSHHLNITVIFLVQNLFYNAKSMRTISLNSHYIILMKNPRDVQQVSVLSRQIFPSYTKYFLESFKDATSVPYGYIRIDLTPDTPENLRLSTRITLEENIYNQFLPILYMKNVEKS